MHAASLKNPGFLSLILDVSMKTTRPALLGRRVLSAVVTWLSIWTFESILCMMLWRPRVPQDSQVDAYRHYGQCRGSAYQAGQAPSQGCFLDAAQAPDGYLIRVF